MDKKDLFDVFDGFSQNLMESDPSSKAISSRKENLENIYEDGFHICTFFYGQRRENNEDCAFCMELLYRE